MNSLLAAPHWRSTVVAGTDIGSAELSTAPRATLQLCAPTWLTHPKMTSSIRCIISGAMPTCAISPSIAGPGGVPVRERASDGRRGAHRADDVRIHGVAALRMADVSRSLRVGGDGFRLDQAVARDGRLGFLRGGSGEGLSFIPDGPDARFGQHRGVKE